MTQYHCLLSSTIAVAVRRKPWGAEGLGVPKDVEHSGPASNDWLARRTRILRRWKPEAFEVHVALRELYGRGCHRETGLASPSLHLEQGPYIPCPPPAAGMWEKTSPCSQSHLQWRLTVCVPSVVIDKSGHSRRQASSLTTPGGRKQARQVRVGVHAKRVCAWDLEATSCEQRWNRHGQEGSRPVPPTGSATDGIVTATGVLGKGQELEHSLKSRH